MRSACALTQTAHQPSPAHEPERRKAASGRTKRRSRWRFVGLSLLVLAGILVAARAALPSFIRNYVQRTIDQSELYQGRIGDIDLYLWRGAYTIEDVRINKITGNVPVPLFSSPRVDLAIEWDALMEGKVVGRILFDSPELNFVDSSEDAGDQTGAGGPWLEIIRDLFPFKINSAVVRNGSIRFRAVDTSPPVELQLEQLEATISNLTNIHDEVTPLVTTVSAKGVAMGHADFEYEMKLDPFSYRPTFQMAARLLRLDVTKTNDLARAYGAFDFEHGWFDLVIELDAKEGRLEGYVKPLFRNLTVLSLDDVGQNNPLKLFWEALVGAASELLKNQPRDQFGTVIPLRGDLTNPRSDLLAILGNVLRNAFIRAYLPRLQGTAENIDDLQFEPGTIIDPGPAGGGP